MVDLYDPCPCGSGKKFKWCCQPIYQQISSAFKQDEDGQHEAGLRLMEQVTRDHPANPEAWGRYAHLLYQNDRADDAEKALDKALELNPSYPFGHFLRGRFRLYEGEIAGGLILLRKASDLYDPEAKDILSQVYQLIFDCEMRLNRPLAARLAGERAYRSDPANQELRKGLDTVYGPENPNLPAAAKNTYQYRSVPANVGSERRAAWDKALASAQGRLSEAAAAFKQLAQADEQDAAAWYNLGLTCAWQGNNQAALDALSRYVELETDDDQAAQAWELAEVLCCGQGMEDHGDFVDHFAVMPLSNPDALMQFMGKLEKEHLLVGVQLNEEKTVLTGVILDKPAPALTAELAAKQAPQLGAQMVLMGNVLRLANPNKEALERTVRLVQETLGLGEIHRSRGPIRFVDVLSPALIFPGVPGKTKEQLEQQVREHAEKHFEESWIHKPLKALKGVPPVDAAGHPQLRKRLRGHLAFLQECGAVIHLPYDFDRLRRKLNLGAAGAPQATAPVATGQADIAAMSVAELSALDLASLTPAQQEEAFQAALKLDARDLAGKFAGALVSAPPRADRPDRYPWFQHLIAQAQQQSDWAGALGRVDEGEKDDCEHNEGRRRNDYELRRGQLLAKQGDVAQAAEVFERLVARVPSELRYRGSAAEALLSAKQPQRALAFAEPGLAEARKQQNRDMEGYLLELIAAAKR